MQSRLSIEQLRLGFHPVGVGHATIYRADGSALGFFVKPDTFCAFIRHNVIVLVRDRVQFMRSINCGAIFEGIRSFNRISIRDRPLNATFIYGVIGALGFASAAIDAFVCYHNCHRTKQFAGWETTQVLELQRYKDLLYCPDEAVKIF